MDQFDCTATRITHAFWGNFHIGSLAFVMRDCIASALRAAVEAERAECLRIALERCRPCPVADWTRLPNASPRLSKAAAPMMNARSDSAETGEEMTYTHHDLEGLACDLDRLPDPVGAKTARECAKVMLQQAVEVERLRTLLKEGADGFGRVLIATTDDKAVRDWQRRARAAAGRAPLPGTDDAREKADG